MRNVGSPDENRSNEKHWKWKWKFIQATEKVS